MKWVGTKPVFFLAACVLACGAVFLLLVDWSPGNRRIQGAATSVARESALGGYKEERAQLRIPLPPAGTPLGETLRLIKEPAKSGVANAACRLVHDLGRCANRIDVVQVAEDFAKFPVPASGGPSMSEVLLNQSEQDDAFCAGVSAKELQEDYTFQKIAADSGNEDYARWLVLSPALNQRDFLNELDAWGDYRRRSERYVQNAISRRDGQDFMLLLSIYAPTNVQIIRPPYRVDDTKTFLALMEVAKRHQISVPTQFIESARQIRGDLKGGEIEEVNIKVSELLPGWAFKSVSTQPHQYYAKFNAPSFCN